jgi:hypothetical protein
MNHRIRAIALGVSSILALQTAARADVIHLKTGGKLEGVVTRETATALTLDLGMGQVTVPLTSVLRVERKESALSEFRTRAAAIVPGNVAAYAELARFATQHNLRSEARLMWERVISYDPRNGEAHRGLGHVLVDGQYVDEEQAYRARGFVQFEGRWMSPAEQGSILREREQRAAADQRAEEARRAARDAEERAARAEAEAQRARDEANVWSPVWGYGGAYVPPAYWGGGGYNPRRYPGYPGCPGPACEARPPHVTPHGQGGQAAAPPVPAARPVKPSSVR